MNEILSLKGKFEQKKNSQKPGAPRLPKNSKVSSEKVLSLTKDLEEMKKFWDEQKIISKALISAYYCKNVAKSNRISGFFTKRPQDINSCVVGSKFDNNGHHIITYLVSKDDLQETIELSKEAADILKKYFSGQITDLIFNDQSTFDVINFNEYSISKTTFQHYITDSHYVNKFDVESPSLLQNNNSIVTFYKTDESLISILNNIGIKVYNNQLLDDRTVLLDTDSLKLLMETAPFLVSMATKDLVTLSPSDFKLRNDYNNLSIPAPSKEPIIGVFDTLFKEDVYFHDWVDYTCMLDPNISIEPQDYYHGTEVSSIIVDGPSFNPQFDDGCGRFRVKHFGVSKYNGFSSFSIIKNIKEAVVSNPDIHVWNISLGSNAEVNKNFISAEASALDEIQFENNVIFVIAGTNQDPNKKRKRIGSPADSINSIVVNSVNNNKKPASYSRRGIVLSFFTKPDVSYYGGDGKNPINVISPDGQYFVGGTSFSAPWIARKLSYLIDVLGLSREIAKALLIDSAIGWKKENDYKDNPIDLIGNGVVPVRIEDVIHSSDDEIKFTLEGTSDMWMTYNYNIPVPTSNNKYPYIAKATLCYFPKCSRNQGVDYTNTELDINFGRIKNDGQIASINNNNQDSNTYPYNYEEEARRLFRKWDNVKSISEVLKGSNRPKKLYDNPMWGIKLYAKERLNNTDGKHIRFGIVITLKEINGVNRIEDFIQQASLKGWLVNRIDIKNRINIYNESEQDIDLE